MRKKNERDPLFFITQLTVVPMEYRLVRGLTLATFISYIWSTCMCIHQFLSTFDLQSLLQYGATTGLQIFALINLGIVVFKIDEINYFTKECGKNFYPLELVDETVYTTFMQRITLTKGIVFANYLLAGVSSVLLILSPDFFYKKVYCFTWICEHYPKNCYKIIFMITLFNFPTAAILASCPALLTYFGINAIFQITILNEFVKNICRSNTSEDERNNSELYQKIVGQKLKICIILHNELLRLSIFGADMIYIPIIMISVGSVIFGSSLILLFLTQEMDHLTLENLGILCTAFTAILSAGLYITVAQLMKNESEQTHYLLTQLPWYFMNMENIKYFSVLLRKTEKPISFYTDLIEVNFVLLVKIFRSMYSAAAVLFQLVTTPQQVMATN